MHSLSLKVGARSSPLSRVQVQEVLQELQQHHPHVQFSPIWIETTGDKDQKTSLRDLEKTNFFTKELDHMQAQKLFQISVHSAKDLPEPLDSTLCVVALTKGVDPHDVLVTRDEQLPEKPIIATSSLRREEEVKRRFKDAIVVDIRGNIGERLMQLDTKKVDGIVMAKAALIRLGLLSRPSIEFETFAPLQGRLAIVARKDDDEMKALFSCIDTRPRMLYIGLRAPYQIDKQIIHVPLIQTIGPPEALQPFICAELTKATHIILTSQTAVHYLTMLGSIADKCVLCIGTKTAEAARAAGATTVHTAKDETQEGVMDLIDSLGNTCPNPYFFWPHSKKSRDDLRHYLEKKKLRFTTCGFYETQLLAPSTSIDFDTIDEIFFSSPSTVDAFRHFFGKIPTNKIVHCQGKITQKYLYF